MNNLISTVPYVGDATQITQYLGIFIGAVVAIVGYLLYLKKKK